MGGCLVSGMVCYINEPHASLPSHRVASPSRCQSCDPILIAFSQNEAFDVCVFCFPPRLCWMPAV